MTPPVLLLIGLAGIAALLFLILVAKLQPFVSLLLVSIAVALAGGIPPASLAQTIEDGMGKTLGHVAIIIALGSMIGRMIEVSGGASAFAKAMIRRFGERRTPLALTIAGFFIGMPVFFEVGVVILMPLAYSVARTTGRPLLVFALPMCIALLIVHALLPPHPGAVAVAGLLGAEVGRILAFGLPVTAVTAAVSFLIARKMTVRSYPMTTTVHELVYGSADESSDVHTDAKRTAVRPAAVKVAAIPDPPDCTTVILLILVPIVLILAGTLANGFLPAGAPARKFLTVLGIPFVALLIDVLLCAWLLGVRRGWSLSHVADVLGSAVPGVAIVILITGAGGVFGNVLVATGIGNAASELLRSTGLPLLALGFLMTMLIRAIQGPTTVALITVAGIIGPLVANAALSPNQLALICLAMGAGGLTFSHVNDAGFWIVTRMIGLKVGDGLRTWTVLTTCAGFIGFLLVSLLWLLL